MAGKKDYQARKNDEGFTLVEILVVMVVLGILLAIAIPYFSGQRQKAFDANTKSDTQRLGHAIALWYTEHDEPGTTVAPPVVRLLDGKYYVGEHTPGMASENTTLVADNGTVDTSNWTSKQWCVAATNPDGQEKTFNYSAANGLRSGDCQPAATTNTTSTPNVGIQNTGAPSGSTQSAGSSTNPTQAGTTNSNPAQSNSGVPSQSGKSNGNCGINSTGGSNCPTRNVQ